MVLCLYLQRYNDINVRYLLLLRQIIKVNVGLMWVILANVYGGTGNISHNVDIWVIWVNPANVGVLPGIIVNYR